MMEIRITAPELSEALNNLARAIDTHRWSAEVNDLAVVEEKAESPVPTVAPVAPVAPVQPTPIPVAPVAPVQPTPIPVALTPVGPTPVVPTPVPVAPVAPTPVVPTTAVPTAAPQYSLEMIAKAGTALIDAGKMGELTALLAKYGVEALTSLNPAQYGVFAADLRAMGASI